MRCIIVDDDPVSIQLLEQFVGRANFLELVDTFTDAISASNFLMENEIDLLFLDVEMPEMSGIELLKTLEYKPQIILVTSKKDYAIEAFEYDVTDYLLKPVEYSRFLKAAQKAKETTTKPEGTSQKQDSLYVKDETIWVNIPFSSILWVEALGDYVTINTEEKKHTVLATMKNIEQKLSDESFMRVHRSYIVNTSRISNLDGNMLIIEKKLIPIGKSYKKALMARLNIL